MSSCFEEFEIPVSAESRHGDGVWLIQPWLVVLVLFGLTSGDDDRGSAENQNDIDNIDDCDIELR